MNLELGDTRLIIDECKKQGLLRNQTAYVLGTCFHETAHTMKPVREYGGEKYLKSKAYYPYVGMGYVQLTWKNNYEKAGKALGVDFVKNPKLLLVAKHAAPILVTGMKEGWFTGKKLADYIIGDKCDYVNARRIINGTDKAQKIAGYAEAFAKALRLAGYVGQAPAKPITIPPAPIAPPAPVVPVPAPVVVPEPVKKPGLVGWIKGWF